MAKQTIKQRKAIRSAAARKGWETRIARERREVEAANAVEDRAFAMAQEALRRAQEPRETVDLLYVATPKPSLWQRIKRWFA